MLPHFDGTLLDNLIDFTNYVIVPALIIHRSGVLPGNASFAMACAICLASAYQFCQADAKTDDNYFTGFPSYWNIAALYLLALGLKPSQNLAIIAVLLVILWQLPSPDPVLVHVSLLYFVYYFVVSVYLTTRAGQQASLADHAG